MLKTTLLGLFAISALILIGTTPITEPITDDLGTSSTSELGGEQRYLTHLSSDKPIYRAGEMVYLRGVMLHAATRKPAEINLNGRLDIKGPKGDMIYSGYAALSDGTIGFGWSIPDDQTGGRYLARISYPDWNQGFAPTERSFEIRTYRAPRLKTQIEFVRDGYGPGDRVSASCRVERAEGGIPNQATVTVIARLDGSEVIRKTASISPQGLVSTFFSLPDRIEKGEGSLLFVFQDGGMTETASKTIPILLQTVEVDAYPEGGELVAGLTNRVYFEARSPNGKPADISGELRDDLDRQIALFKTVHEGRGSVRFKAHADRRYRLVITKPTGIGKHIAMPAVKTRGAVVQWDPNQPNNSKVQLQVGSPIEGRVLVTLARLEKELSRQTVSLTAGRLKKIVLDAHDGDGVLIATVWDQLGQPLAERLVFRRPDQQLNVALSFDQTNAMPGESVSLTVKTSDAAGLPVGAVVGLTVSDDSILEMVEKREQAPRLPVMVLLENEVRDLADAHVYLDPENEDAPMQLDLLLATQGWRRFARTDWDSFQASFGEDAERALAFRLVRTPEPKKKDGFLERLGRAVGVVGDELNFAAAAPMEMEAGNKQRQAEPVPAPMAAGKVAAPMLEEEIGGLFEAKAERDQMRAGRGERRLQLMTIRQFAHKVRANRAPNERADFSETLYWNAALRTDARTGTAVVHFDLNDSVTSFRASADAYTSEGVLGKDSLVISSVKPFFSEPKPPLQISAGDTVELPIGLVNNTYTALTGKLKVSLDGENIADLDYRLEPRSRARRNLTLVPDQIIGTRTLVIESQAGTYDDRVTRTIEVVAKGFPVAKEFSGVLSAEEALSFAFEIPQKTVAASMKTQSTAYPTPLASLGEALGALIREPSGCFEQTSSTSYPLVMVQQYFDSHHGIDPEKIADVRAKLGRAYNRLTGFECKERGYEWFGQGAGHEALTAYGLMQFNDMNRVHQVDETMMTRTHDWLISRRDGKGGFSRNTRALDSFGGAPQATTDAYITWALSESGFEGLDREIDRLGKLAQNTKDSYIIALASAVTHAQGSKEIAAQLMKKLVANQAADGHVQGGVTSITRSGGQSLVMETTALSLLAWMQADGHNQAVEKGMRYLADNCESGRFGSTQATVLALRAIVTYDKKRARPVADGQILLRIDGELVDQPIGFSADHQGAIALPNFTHLLSPGKHQLSLEMIGGGAMPVSATVSFNSDLPVSDDRCQPRLTTRLSPRIREGEATEMQVTVSNPSDEVIPTPVAIIGLPGGLEPRHDQLQELVKKGLLAAYEVDGSQIVCYWRGLKAGQSLSFPISCIAAVPGRYTAPASRIYAYYTDEYKHWVEGQTVTVAVKQ